MTQPIPDEALDSDIAIIARKLRDLHGTLPIRIDDKTIAEPEVIDRIFGDRISLTTSGCWRRTGASGNALGHKKLSVHDRPVWAHRVAFALVHGPIPAGMAVCHRCDVPDCVNPEHLFLGSQLDNVQDAKRKGRAVDPPILTGARHHSATLTDAQVSELVAAMKQPGSSQRAVAKRFGVSQSTAWRLLHGVSRAQVEKQS